MTDQPYTVPMSTVIVAHDEQCPPRNRTTLGGHSDSAKRCADAYNLHRDALGAHAIGCWIAVALADGSHDGVAYQTRRECVTHQHHDEQWYAYVNIRPTSMTVCEAASFMAFNRQAYQNGFRLTDPEHRAGGRSLITRLTVEDQLRHATALRAGLWIPGRT